MSFYCQVPGKRVYWYHFYMSLFDRTGIKPATSHSWKWCSATEQSVFIQSSFKSSKKDIKRYEHVSLFMLIPVQEKLPVVLWWSLSVLLTIYTSTFHTHLSWFECKKSSNFVGDNCWFHCSLHYISSSEGRYLHEYQSHKWKCKLVTWSKI